VEELGGEFTASRISVYFFWAFVACGSVLECGLSFCRRLAARLVAAKTTGKLASAKEVAARKCAFEESWVGDEASTRKKEKQSSKKASEKSGWWRSRQ